MPKKKEEKDTIKVWFHAAVYSLLKVKHILWRTAPKFLGTLNTLSRIFGHISLSFSPIFKI